MEALMDWVKTALKKRKVKIFLIFLMLSTFAWLINNLSQTYTSNTFFDIEYINIPNDVMLANKPKSKIQVRLKAGGFKFLSYGLVSKKITLDVTQVLKNNTGYRLTPDQIKIQLAAQLAKNIVLVDFDKDPIYFEFTSLLIKKVKIVPRLDLSFANNFILEGDIKVKPDSVELTGPRSKIDTIKVVYTESKKLSDLTTDFSLKKVALALPNIKEGIKVSTTTTVLSGTVVKFSEKIVKVPVVVVNLKSKVKVRTFPEFVEVRCQGTLANLKGISATDFRVEADYSMAANETDNRLPLTLVTYPIKLNNAAITINEVEFILRRE